MTNTETFENIEKENHTIVLDKSCISLCVYRQKETLMQVLKYFKYSHSKIAKACGVVPSVVGFISANRRPKLQTLLAFACSLGLSPKLEITNKRGEMTKIDFSVDEAVGYTQCVWSIKDSLKKRLTAVVFDLRQHSALTEEELVLKSGVNLTSLREVLGCRCFYNHSAESIVKVLMALDCSISLSFDYGQAKSIKRGRTESTLKYGKVFTHDSVFLQDF